MQVTPRFMFLAIGLGLVVVQAIPAFASPQAEPVDAAPDRRYLAVDTTLHDALEHITLDMKQARRTHQLWRQFDAPWEEKHGLTLGALGRVIRDHEGRYRMYYELMHANAERVTAVAFSEDGVHWTKPALNLAPAIVDHPASNLLSVSPPEDDEGRGLLDGKWYRGAHAFYDAHATTPGARYKLVWRQGHDMYVASSEDGLRFVTHGRAIDYYADTCPSHFFDPRRDAYVIYGRVWLDKKNRPTVQDRLGADGDAPARRGVVLHRSPAWEKVPWPEARVKEVLIDPLDVFNDGGWTDIYTPNVQVYHDQYVALPAVFFRRVLPDRTGTAGPIYPVFMHSTDGRHWTFPDKKHPIIHLGPHRLRTGEGMEAGMIFPASNILVHGEELWIYYAARGYQHYADSPGNRDDVTYNLAVLRRDGFASLLADDTNQGVWRTPAIAVPKAATTLHVNADVAGKLVVELCDAESGIPLEGLTATDCVPYTGNDTDATLTWQSAGLDTVAGRRVHFHFHVIDGEIFSFWFD